MLASQIIMGTVQDSAWPDSDLFDVPIADRSLDAFVGIAEPAQYAALQAASATARERFSGRVIWSVNRTSRGGGVAEMLRPLLGYIRGAGVDAHWRVLRGDPGLFRVTKRIHNHLHGAPGDGGDLGTAERDAYVASLEPSVRALQRLVHPEDVCPSARPSDGRSGGCCSLHRRSRDLAMPCRRR